MEKELKKNEKNEKKNKLQKPIRKRKTKSE